MNAVLIRPTCTQPPTNLYCVEGGDNRANEQPGTLRLRHVDKCFTSHTSI